MSAKKLTSKMVKEYGLSRGLDLVGIANIERFKDAPKHMSPTSIFPEARSVIVVARRIVRGNWRGIEEGTYWPAYTYFGYSGYLNKLFIPKPLYELSCFIEDFGWEAAPCHPGVPERQSIEEPVRPDSPPSNVWLAIRIAGLAAGLGEMGWSKVFLTKKFGPRVRLSAIITDAELEPDNLVEPGSICDKCMACVKGCPGAIPHIKDGKTVKLCIEDKQYEWGDVDMGKCTLAHHGLDARFSPFLKKSLPGLDFDITKQGLSEEMAYEFSMSISRANWPKSVENPSGYVVEGHAKIKEWCDGGFAVEGSRGCMRSCFDHLEKCERIEQTFQNPFIKRKRWKLDLR